MVDSDTITVAITGASGAQYGLRLVEQLVQADRRIYVLISKAAQMVMALEMDLSMPSNAVKAEELLMQMTGATKNQINVFGREDWTSPVASGSGAPRQMVVCPCSTGTLSAVAAGACNNLIERAADVVLKERGQLIMVPRETPLSTIHLQNMLTLSQMGVVILPAMPGFYQRPESVDDMVDFIVARILNQLGIKQQLLKPWGDSTPQSPIADT
ncbi:flavin prenyltransferase UbiX [Gynuella sunshinyii]|uniref:Flavin prenyltransferase UbiX n=1 Tax=Gynuella sunshinyii YC6258 TaxID=1445510 RepID=A0A0C5VRJ9_9GAMM|nr:flavin prenyltransferase UbiX [Gynuella sunshinyii]AJQ96866.1 3-polyprenyl-4-hydroxybenzoate decarboxylase [Gynuella sunshinyii YC6258]